MKDTSTGQASLSVLQESVMHGVGWSAVLQTIFFCNVGSGALEQACPGRVVDVRCRLASASKTGRDADLLSRVLDSIAGGSFGQFGFFIRS